MQILRKTNLEALEKAKKIGKQQTLKLIEQKGLVGRGGAAFPTAKKWKFAINTEADERFLICNADEGEPGTFKDKFIIENNPETLIEGILIAALTIDAKRCFIYLRGEYISLKNKLEKTIKQVLDRSGLDITIDIVMGAGAYVCGEETAIIQSIMGYRGHPQVKPPYPPVEGLWNKATIINNVETLTNVAQLILYDDWDPNLRLFSLSGNIEHPGVYELPLGVKMSSIVDIVKPKNPLKAMSFGCFGGIMPFNKDIEIDDKAIFKNNCFHGAYTIILIDNTNNIVDVSYSIAKFYTYESCGKCTPCREGNIRLLNLLKKVRNKEATEKDLHTLQEFAQHIQDTSLCGLGQSCGNHILTGLQHFREDYVNYNED
jgi:NADH:ubiquinone oxidoreductase subunit F (NADH-binding)